MSGVFPEALHLRKACDASSRLSGEKLLEQPANRCACGWDGVAGPRCEPWLAPGRGGRHV